VDGEATFAAWSPKPAGDRTVLEQLPASAAARVVRRVLNAGIRAEGPIHVDRLAKLTAGAFGVTRLTEARKTALLSVLPPSALAGDWLWPDAIDRATWTGFRRQASSTERSIDHVAPEEVVNAMTALCRAGAGAERDALLSATAAVFGYRRRTPTATAVLEEVLAGAVAAGRLTVEPSGLITA
jgi:hypothetical protein